MRCAASSPQLPGLASHRPQPARVQYKQTTKSPQQIGRELGVRVSSHRHRALGKGSEAGEPGAGESRTDPGRHGFDHSGKQPFEAPLTDVFQVQGQIAGRVAEALGVALGAGEQRATRANARPRTWPRTMRSSVARRRADGLASLDPAALRRARDYYEQAVALDSSFALAWAQLSRALLVSLLECPTPLSSGDGRSPRRRAVAGARAQSARRSSGPRQLLRNGAARRAARARAVHEGAAACAQGRPAAGLGRVG